MKKPKAEDFCGPEHNNAVKQLFAYQASLNLFQRGDRAISLLRAAKVVLEDVGIKHILVGSIDLLLGDEQ